MPPLTPWLSDRLPAVVGWLRPVILWPDAAMMASLLMAVLVTGVAPPREACAEGSLNATSRIEGLTPEQARKLVAEFKGPFLHLGGLTTLDSDTAKALAAFKGTSLHLNGLATLHSDTVKALAEFAGSGLGLTGLTKLDADAAKALTEFKGQWLGLDGVTALDADTAKALAEFQGQKLDLDGVTTLDAATAKALAEFQGHWLGLNGLTALDADTAKALVGFAGSGLGLDGLTTLDSDTAKELAANVKWTGRLSALTALKGPDSVAVARALATRKGRLSLPNLKKISPKTLTALIEKQDVQIPLIETLELIPEPDGSATDDFVIPPRLERQQQRTDEYEDEDVDADEERNSGATRIEKPPAGAGG